MDDRQAERAGMLSDIDAAFHRLAGATGLSAPDPRVRAVMGVVPREVFVSPARQSEAYLDSAVSIACGQTISQPFIVALMTTLLAIEPAHVVLEVGTGSGYQAAVLSRLCRQVYSVERWPLLATTAGERLRALGCDNVAVRCADGNLGWPEAAPFDGILVTCAAATVPPILFEQLAPFGRMVVPLGQAWDLQQLALITRDAAGRVHRRDVLPVRFVPLVSGVAPPTGMRAER